MTSNIKEDLITKVAWLYYKEKLTQQDISSRVNISRQKVQRFLEKARDLEIVRFQVKNPYANLLSIESELIEKYSLKDSVVVPYVSDNDDLLRKSFAKAGASYLERIISQHNNSIVGLGWGNTITYLADYFDSLAIKTKVEVVSLKGNLMTNVAMNPYIIAEKIANKLDAPFYNIWAPAIAQSKEMAEMFKSEPWINHVLQIASKANIILFSIGEVSPSASLFKMGYLSSDELKRLREKGAVGDILNRFFNAQGTLIDDEIHERVISIPINKLKDKGKIVIGVAGGSSKFEAIRGALNGKYINILITDEKIGQQLINSNVS